MFNDSDFAEEMIISLDIPEEELQKRMDEAENCFTGATLPEGFDPPTIRCYIDEEGVSRFWW